MAVDLWLFGLLEDARSFIGHEACVDEGLNACHAISIFEEIAGAVDVDTKVEIWARG